MIYLSIDSNHVTFYLNTVYDLYTEIRNNNNNNNKKFLIMNIHNFICNLKVKWKFCLLYKTTLSP